MKSSTRVSTLVLGLVAAMGFAMTSSHMLLATPGDDLGDKAAEVQPQIVRIAAQIDGSGRMIFTSRKASYEHRHWAEPSNVVIDDTQWAELGQAPTNWAQLAAQLDLTKAYIVKRMGRDTIALETTREGFDLYFCDTPDGPAAYEVTIAIPKKK